MSKISTRRSPTGGCEVTRFNALQHGLLSRYTVLPWENEDEYRALLDALVTEHKPRGPTEEHLVEELAGVIWRKRRLRLAEGALCRQRLKIAPSKETKDAALAHLDLFEERPDSAAKQLTDLAQNQTTIESALQLLRAGKARSYDKALGNLREEMREQWHELTRSKPIELLDFSQPSFSQDSEGLLQFLEGRLSRCDASRRELENQPLIREQVVGEALDLDRLDALFRYEVQLDRKLERMLTMLIRLQDLRRASAANSR
jgi:hypothetical protein